MKTNIEAMRAIANTSSGRLKRELLNKMWFPTRSIFTIPDINKEGYMADLDELFEYTEQETSFWRQEI